VGAAAAAHRGAQRLAEYSRKKLKARIEWEKSRGDAQKLAESGLGNLIGKAPELDPLATAARHCWLFCGGWAPERWCVYGALHPVPDWHLLIEAMEEIRRHV
jgi:hypothetical protein